MIKQKRASTETANCRDGCIYNALKVVWLSNCTSVLQVDYAGKRNNRIFIQEAATYWGSKSLHTTCMIRSAPLCWLVVRLWVLANTLT